jgi:hypothetical protein
MHICHWLHLPNRLTRYLHIQATLTTGHQCGSEVYFKRFIRVTAGQNGSGEVIMVLLWGTKRKCMGRFFFINKVSICLKGSKTEDKSTRPKENKIFTRSSGQDQRDLVYETKGKQDFH